MKSSARHSETRVATIDSMARKTSASAWDEIVGYAGPGSITWRIGREWAMLLGAGRAVLMQLAHPLVAAGVTQHSSFDVDPLGRSQRTVEFTQVMAFGTRSQAHAVARSVNRLHTGVVGQLGHEVGVFSADAAYRARDPELLLWVYATLVDTALVLYPQLVAPLNRAEQRRYYEESKRTTALLGLPREMLPRTLDDFEAYVDGMLQGPRLCVTPEARALGHQLLHLPAPAPVRLLYPMGEMLTAGFMPRRLREEYGFAWSARREGVFRFAVAVVRAALPIVPPLLRCTPWSRRAAVRLALAQALCCP